MKRPLAYISYYNSYPCDQEARKYCREVYKAGYTPICPILYIPFFICGEIPEEHKDGVDISHQLLRRCQVLVVCGKVVDGAMVDEIAIARRLGIVTTTLEGIQTVQGKYKGGTE